jgi:hypothetical protein
MYLNDNKISVESSLLKLTFESIDNKLKKQDA